jgi:nucleoside-triphosphatase THEP1
MLNNDANRRTHVKGMGDGADRPLRILLVGERKSGKTTCCLTTARMLREQAMRPGGVVCPKLYDDTGRVTGIEVLNILTDPPSREVLARTDCCMDGPSTGAYHFSERGLQFGRDALEAGARLGNVVFADEFGPLEIRGKGFSNLLDLARTPSTPPMVIVVRRELVSQVCKALEPLAVTELEIHSSNRDLKPSRLLDLLRGSI